MTAVLSAHIPRLPSLSLEELDGLLVAMHRTARCAPFADEAVELTDTFSRMLLSDKNARPYPELQVLGYWLRRSAIGTMRTTFTMPGNAVAVAQGVAFHIPPANVDTMFAYSLFMSVLAGNANIIRLPSRRDSVMELLLSLLHKALQTAPAALRDQVLILEYGYDNEITEHISRAADLRVIWGGDHTVNTIRAIPSSPWTRELVFPDRFSWSAINASSYIALNDQQRSELAKQYFNDLFWFDQAGCSSPRVIVWNGAASEDLTTDFYNRVTAIATARQWRLDDGASVLKQAQNYAAMIDQPVVSKHDFQSTLTVMGLNGVGDLKQLRKNPGFGGTLFEIRIENLEVLTPHIERRDQTFATFGFEKTQLQEFALALNGRGFDRFVPIGQALSFEAIWDGYDLMKHFTRLVTVRT